MSTTSKKTNENSKSERWVCRSCSALLTALNDDIIKINGSYHKHEPISAEEVSQILSFWVKNRVMQTNEPILKIAEKSSFGNEYDHGI